jgi:hypothetical protein
METINDDKTSQSDSDAISTLSSAYISLGISLGLKKLEDVAFVLKR